MNTAENDFCTHLIEAVREERILYCKGEAGYTDRNAKRKAWERVSEKTGKPADECEKRWQLLREKFGRECRRMELTSGSGADKETPWPYFETMSYLKQHIKRRKDKSYRTSESEASTSYYLADLIEAVREERILYCKGEAGYTDRNAKKRAWERVSEKTGKPADECEKRWRLLREKFGRECRRMELASGSGADKETPWPYFETMSYLKQHIKRRKARDNSSRNSESEASVSYYVADETLMSPPLMETSAEDSTFRETPRRRKTAVLEHERDLADKFSEVLDAYKRKLESQPVAESEDELFMKIAVKMMEPLPLVARDRLKNEILTLITNERRLYDTSDM